MGIILKNTVKNISNNPFRSFVLIICVIVMCLTALFSLDLGSNMETIYGSFYKDIMGNTDVTLECKRPVDEAIFDNLPECVYVAEVNTENNIATRDPELYSYEIIHSLKIVGVDIQSARKMDMFKTEFTLSDNETAISETYADMLHINCGESIMLMDENGINHEFIVKTIIPEVGPLVKRRQCTAVVNLNGIKALKCSEKLKSTFYYIDIVNDNQIDEFCNLYKAFDPSATVQIQNSGADGNKMIMLFIVLFVITFLMVIFVTVSLSEKIVNERMQVIGTFRSLGMSPGLTTFILLAENAGYGLIGYTQAMIIYGISRNTLFSSLVSGMFVTNVDIGTMKIWVPFVVLAGAVVIECFVPLIALMRAVKVSIRDIIFSNKDTDYVLSKSRNIVGTVFLVFGLITVFIQNEIILILGIILLVIGCAMIMPVLVNEVSKILKKVFGKAGMAVAELASIEVGTKKSTISNSILCLTVAALTIAVFATANGLIATTEYISFDADIFIDMSDQSRESYKYIEDINGVEEIYYLDRISDYIEINGKEQKGFVDILGFPQKDFFLGVPNLPDELSEDECVLSSAYAKELAVKEGDRIDVTFKRESMFPIKRSLRVVKLSNTALFTSSPLIVISERFYKNLYHDYFYGIYIKSDDADNVAEEIERYFADQSVAIYTMPQWIVQKHNSSNGIRTGVYAAMFFALLLSIVGLSGNQVLGFEARRREYAVMYSTCMTRKQIARLIFLETLISTSISVIWGTILGLIVSKMIGRVTDALSMSIPVGMTCIQYLSMIAVLIVIMVTVSLKPMKLLKKMKVVEELKYE